jgi:hypothetical protein
VTLGFALLATVQASAQEDVADRLKEAHEAARANAATPEGREWKRDNSFATNRLLSLTLNRCLPDTPGDIPTPFSLYLRFSKAGSVQEIITDLDPSLDKCMTTVAGDLPFPEAPRDDYWVQVNMAASL